VKAMAMVSVNSLTGESLIDGCIFLCRLVQGIEQAFMDPSGMELGYLFLTFSIHCNFFGASFYCSLPF
jgi:hypothetical protein